MGRKGLHSDFKLFKVPRKTETIVVVPNCSYSYQLFCAYLPYSPFHKIPRNFLNMFTNSSCTTVSPVDSLNQPTSLWNGYS